MYRPHAFAVDDIATLHAFIRANAFATVAVAHEGEVHFAYAPIVLDEKGTLRFHLARNNPAAMHADGTKLSFSFMGPHTYISPDWYESTAMVPTWNYIAVEGQGVARKLDATALRQLLIDLSAAQEKFLLPKQPWTLDTVPEARVAALVNAIDGFEVALENLEGKFKLSQDKKPEDFAGVLSCLEARGDAAGAAIAREMRKLKR
ncbi:MAG TPA: FMN-binding negative transcriptional regulator [Rhizomicrobium sp.]|nr:FMN-binding negative transcriptional regulator [Rhizomicrobium sp.]